MSAGGAGEPASHSGGLGFHWWRGGVFCFLLKAQLAEMGYDLSDNEFGDAFKRFKDLADAKKQVFDEDIVALVDDEVLRGHDRIQVLEVEVYCGSNGPQRAILTLSIDGEEVTAATRGNGPVDALFNAIRKLVPHDDAVLNLYQVHAVTAGTDAQAEVSVVLAEHGRTVRGTGAHTDTLVASARAYVNALNKLIVKRGKSALSAPVGLYCFAADNEFGAEVYSGATTEKQAWEVFRPARLMAKRTPALLDHYGIEVNASNLNIPADGARFEPLIGNPGDGQSPSCAIVDEYHEHDSDDLYTTMITGMGARRQPLMWVITTAGYNIDGPCYDKRREVLEMLADPARSARLGEAARAQAVQEYSLAKMHTRYQQLLERVHALGTP